ncbi:MAG: energy-coupling factor transporter transmembrane protein EcfT [Halobacteriaceae archaeon]
MLAYEPGDSLAHTLDARAKLAFQAAFAVAAFAHTTPRGLVAAGAVTLGVLALSRTPPLRTLWAFRGFLPFLLAAPLVEGARLGPPWFVPEDAVFPALAGVRVGLTVLVGAAYVRTTRVRESRAAVQWLVPGRVGVFLGLGVGMVFRLLPVLRADLARIRSAMHARLAAERSLRDRIRLVGVTGLGRAFGRSEALSLALRARCFAWNPTLPPLSFSGRDWATLAAATVVAATATL